MSHQLDFDEVYCQSWSARIASSCGKGISKSIDVVGCCLASHWEVTSNDKIIYSGKSLAAAIEAYNGVKERL